MSAWLIGLFAAPAANAMDTFDTTVIDPAGVFGIDVPTAFSNLASVLQNTIMPVCGAIFALGALLYIASAGNDERKNQGKEFMIGAVIGLGVVVAANTILDLTIYFIYG